MNVKTLKRRVQQETARLHKNLVELSRTIHLHPELGFKEFQAAENLTAFLERQGFKVERGIGGLPTAFRARQRGKRGGPTVAIIAEYDALPGLGHACGHNLIGTAGVGAGAALLPLISELAGEIQVIGTPAEEGGGGKVILGEQGVLDAVDAAMMCHPSNRTQVVRYFLSMVNVRFTYLGKASHASAFPHHGINALDAAIGTFNAINALRQQLPADVRIHGIITEGGEAPNIIPERAAAHFYVRTIERSFLEPLLRKVIDCARGAAKAAGAKLKLKVEPIRYMPFKPNRTLADLFRKNLENLGMKEQLILEDIELGSSDIGNVSQLVPTIHPEIAIAPEDVTCHTAAFEVAANSKRGDDMIVRSATLMAQTALDVLLSPRLVRAMHDEFNST